MGRNDPPELDEQPMLGSVFFNRSRRSQDVAWKWLYVASVLLTFVGGIYALIHRWAVFMRGSICFGRSQGCQLCMSLLLY
jgi:hypothetical protein